MPGFEELYRMRESSTAEDNAAVLARFLDIEPTRGYDIATTDHLFAD